MVELPDDPERDLRTLLRQLNAPTLGNELLDRILARVHAEAVAEQAETVSELNDLITTLTAEFDEFDQRLAAARAEAVADERQRIKAGLMEEFYEDDPKTDRDHGYNAGIRQALWVMESGFVAGAVLVASVDGRIDAAIEWARQNADAVDVTRLFEALGAMPGSIPVATPPDYFVITVEADGSLTTAPCPVATPTRCESQHPRYGRCQFLPGHTVDHVTGQGADGDDDPGYSWPVATSTQPADPTYGRIDPDIQRAVDALEPESIGCRVAMENTLQARRDAAAPTEPVTCRHGRVGGCGLDGINESASPVPAVQPPTCAHRQLCSYPNCRHVDSRAWPAGQEASE